MATIKSYTDLSQSKKLAETLPIESADMSYVIGSLIVNPPIKYGDKTVTELAAKGVIPCWSLAALLNVLPKGYSIGKRTNGKYYVCMTNIKHNISELDNPIDACYEMIIRLHELNLL